MRFTNASDYFSDRWALVERDDGGHAIAEFTLKIPDVDKSKPGVYQGVDFPRHTNGSVPVPA